MDKHPILSSFKYQIPFTTKLLLFIFPLLGIVVLLSFSVGSLLDILIIFGLLCVFIHNSILILSDHRHPRFINTYSWGIELRTNPYKVNKKKILKYKDIVSIKAYDDGHIVMITKGARTSVNTMFMNLSEAKILMNALKKELPEIALKPCNKILGIFYNRELIPSIYISTLTIFMLGSLLFTVMSFGFIDRQIESDLILMTALVIALLTSAKTYKLLSKMNPQKPLKKPFILSLSYVVWFSLALSLYSGSTLLNQIADTSSEIQSIGFLKARGDNLCAILQDEELKKADIKDPDICWDILPKEKPNSKVVVTHRKGFLGQRWIASIKVVD